MKRALAIIKKPPAWRTPHRRVVQRYRSLNNRSNTVATTSRNLVEILTRSSNSISYPLSVKSVGNPRGKLAVFASQRKIVSSAIAGNVPPRKKALSVYMEARCA
jgi:hypothetical protein